MSVIDRLLAVMAPYECLGCDTEGALLCTDCLSSLLGKAGDERCYRCQRLSDDGATCPACTTSSHLRAVHVVSPYSGAAKELVARLKFAGARSVADVIVAAMAAELGQSGSMAVVPVPTATSRVRRRGYDQAKLLARSLSRRARMPYLDCLIRSGQTEQIGADRGRRLEQLNGAFRVNKANLQGRRLLLIDDVITTGATLEAAAATLAAAGAGTVEALVFCAA